MPTAHPAANYGSTDNPVKIYASADAIAQHALYDLLLRIRRMAGGFPLSSAAFAFGYVAAANFTVLNRLISDQWRTFFAVLNATTMFIEKLVLEGSANGVLLEKIILGRLNSILSVLKGYHQQGNAWSLILPVMLLAFLRCIGEASVYFSATYSTLEEWGAPTPVSAVVAVIIAVLQFAATAVFETDWWAQTWFLIVHTILRKINMAPRPYRIVREPVLESSLQELRDTLELEPTLRIVVESLSTTNIPDNVAAITTIVSSAGFKRVFFNPSSRLPAKLQAEAQQYDAQWLLTTLIAHGTPSDALRNALADPGQSQTSLLLKTVLQAEVWKVLFPGLPNPKLTDLYKTAIKNALGVNTEPLHTSAGWLTLNPIDPQARANLFNAMTAYLSEPSNGQLVRNLTTTYGPSAKPYMMPSTKALVTGTILTVLTLSMMWFTVQLASKQVVQTIAGAILPDATPEQQATIDSVADAWGYTQLISTILTVCSVTLWYVCAYLDRMLEKPFKQTVNELAQNIVQHPIVDFLVVLTGVSLLASWHASFVQLDYPDSFKYVMTFCAYSAAVFTYPMLMGPRFLSTGQAEYTNEQLLLNFLRGTLDLTPEQHETLTRIDDRYQRFAWLTVAGKVPTQRDSNPGENNAAAPGAANDVAIDMGSPSDPASRRRPSS